MSKRHLAVYMGKESRHEPSACLNCGKVLDAATGIGNKRKIRAGAITICIACGHLMAWSGSAFRALTDEEMVGIAGDERVIKMQAALAEYRKWKATKAERWQPMRYLVKIAALVGLRLGDIDQRRQIMRTLMTATSNNIGEVESL